jgi:hypothetical protein
MTVWDFLHAHADGIGGLIGLFMSLVFLAWFTKEVNRD